MIKKDVRLVVLILICSFFISSFMFSATNKNEIVKTKTNISSNFIGDIQKKLVDSTGTMLAKSFKFNGILLILLVLIVGLIPYILIIVLSSILIYVKHIPNLVLIITNIILNLILFVPFCYASYSSHFLFLIIDFLFIAFTTGILIDTINRKRCRKCRTMGSGFKTGESIVSKTHDYEQISEKNKNKDRSKPITIKKIKEDYKCSKCAFEWSLFSTEKVSGHEQ